MVQMRKASLAALKALLAGFAVWAVAPIVMLLAWMVYDAASVPPEQARYAQYAAFISAHEQELLEGIRRAEAGEQVQFDGVMSVNSRSGTVEFLMHGSGFGSATNYYGFYYSPEDVPLTAMGMFLHAADGERWDYESSGDNRGYTRRLMKNWFYYEAHF